MTRWMDAAACRGEDPELFFTRTPEALAEARAVCARCPVRLRCLGTAQAQGDRFGVRGGLTPPERRKLEAGICGAALAVTVLPVPSRPGPAGEADIIAAVKALGIPPDPDAALHRAVLLRELEAFHAAHSGDLLAERRRRPAVTADDDTLREAQSRAQHLRRAGKPVPAGVAALERERWRRTRRGQRQAAREMQHAA